MHIRETYFALLDPSYIRWPVSIHTGTGLFVGSGSALANGGPASLVIAYGIIGIMLFCTVHALGELAVAFPISGSFAVYSSRFIDDAWGKISLHLLQCFLLHSQLSRCLVRYSVLYTVFTAYFLLHFHWVLFDNLANVLNRFRYGKYFFLSQLSSIVRHTHILVFMFCMVPIRKLLLQRYQTVMTFPYRYRVYSGCLLTFALGLEVSTVPTNVSKFIQAECPKPCGNFVQTLEISRARACMAYH